MAVIQKVGAVIWRSGKVEEMLRFYRLLGIPLDHDSHEGEGHTRHYEADIGGVHYALFERQQNSNLDAGAFDVTMLGFQVSDLTELVSKLEQINTRFKIKIEDTPWGKRVVVFDPDGRPVELYQP